MASKTVSFVEEVKKNGMSKKAPFRRGKSLLGPLPECTFGPKAITKPDFSRDYTLDPENQKLTWSRPPESILIIKKIGNDTNAAFKSMVCWLSEVKGFQVYVEPDILSNTTLTSDKEFAAVHSKLKPYQGTTKPSLLSNLVDLVITIGGDGTLLYATSLFQCSMPPVIAFRSGSLGFLTGHDLVNYKETINMVLAGEAVLMLRSRLRCKLERASNSSSVDRFVGVCENGNEETLAKSSGAISTDSQRSCLVLNDIVVNRGVSQYLCNIDLYLEGRRITSVQGDGLIVSTPTGSTAYAVAAGASMVHPDVPSIMITPICPHSLSFRPIIVPSGAELKFHVSENARGSAWVSFDGSSPVELKKGDFVSIRTSVHPAPCVCKSNPFDDWFDSLSQCLHWNARQSQKKLE